MASTIGFINRYLVQTQAKPANPAGTSQSWICCVQTGNENSTPADISEIARASRGEPYDLRCKITACGA